MALRLQGPWDTARNKQKTKDVLRGLGIKSTPELDEEIYNIDQSGYDGPFPMMEERFPAPETRGLSEQTITGPNSAIERSMTGTEGPRMTPEMLKEMARKRQQQEVQSGGAQSEAEEKFGPAQRGRRAPLMEGLDKSVGRVGEQPSEEQLGMLGRNPALAGIN